MALIHEELYKQEHDMAAIDLAVYAKNLSRSLIANYNSPLSIDFDLMPTRLTVEKCIPCGLILNELITNAVKYAYPEGVGRILVRVGTNGNECWLTVSDQGSGLPPGFDPTNSNSLGMTIVQALVRQLGAKLEMGPPPGTSFNVSFRCN